MSLRTGLSARLGLPTRCSLPMGPALIALLCTVSTALAALALPSAALAVPAAPQVALDLSGFRFTSSSYYVQEDAGKAVITVTRTDTSRAGQVRYITLGKTAESPYDYTPEKAMLSFAPGQATASFDVPIVDHGVTDIDKTIELALFGPSPIGMGTPHVAILTIEDDDAPTTTIPDDPLGLPGATTATDPLAGARFFVDHHGEAAAAAKRDGRIDVIADQPGAARFGSFSYPNAELSVSRYLARASVEEPGTIPLLTTYRIVDGHCGDDPAQVRSYESFAKGFAEGIGSYRAVLFMEQDSLITSGCLSPHYLAVRMSELRYQIAQLEKYCPHLVVYLDAGAADALPAKRAAQLLVRAGVKRIQGFFLDATHFDWTLKEVAYGEEVSKLTGGAHFVVNTGESGQGPLVPSDRVEHGNEVLCNPLGRGLGPKPTADTGLPRVDAYVWIDNPGGSSGLCNGGPKAGAYWPKYALMLIHHADYTPRWGKVTSLPKAEREEDAIIDRATARHRG